MSVVGNQRRVLLELLRRLQPHVRRDPALPARLERMLRRDRRLGARDRRLYRELIYTTWRYLPWVESLVRSLPDRAADAIGWLAADTDDTRAFRAESTRNLEALRWPAETETAEAGLPLHPDTVSEKAEPLAPLIGAPARLLPQWIEAECPEAFQHHQYEALARRAPLWLRLQTDHPAAVTAEFDARGWSWKRSGLLAGALRILGEADVTATAAYRRGQVEIQDLGSQLILAAVGVDPGGRWLDACAGAGGKSLQLASLLGPKGRVEAHDVRPEALAELGRRALRAGLQDRISQPRTPAGPYDGVLVDAPCSGSGTWRRAPHLKWVTTPATVAACARRQLRLLAQSSWLVAPGGRLVYATCSLCRSENEGVLGQFLASHPAFAPAPWAHRFSGEFRGDGLLFWPAAHDGDGFFAASLRRIA